MRACSGCRKRKIKCDSATTNVWPCSACTRLRLVCLPPTIGQDGDFTSFEQIQEVAQQTTAVHAIQSPTTGDARHAAHQIQQPASYFASSPYPLDNMRGYNEDPRLAHPQPYLGGSSEDQRRLYQPEPLPLGFPTAQGFQHSQQHLPTTSALFPIPPSQNVASGPNTDPYLQAEPSATEDLSDALGELKIDETGIGMNSLSNSIAHPSKIVEFALMLWAILSLPSFYRTYGISSN